MNNFRLMTYVSLLELSKKMSLEHFKGFALKSALLRKFRAFVETAQEMNSVLGSKPCLPWTLEQWDCSLKNYSRDISAFIREPYILMPHSLGEDIKDFPELLLNKLGDMDRLAKNTAVMFRLFRELCLNKQNVLKRREI